MNSSREKENLKIVIIANIIEPNLLTKKITTIFKKMFEFIYVYLCSSLFNNF
jgi:hypothetical protein